MKVYYFFINIKELTEGLINKFLWARKNYGWQYAIKKTIRKITQKNKKRKEMIELISSEVGQKLYLQLFQQTKSQSNTYIPLSNPSIPATDLKIIAFYLPQYHPFYENNINWGLGFTDWINVAKAVPQYIGHYQPHLPGELGYYDLRLKEIQIRQAELAKQYGIFGFCFHHYWFDGKGVMRTPIDIFLKNHDINIKFCINWANENWTRRWDGKEDDILIAQRYSDDDDLAFIADTARYFRDERYIRINGKPLLIVYRPELFPNPKTTAERWREWCKKNGIGEIFLVTTHGFKNLDPNMIGFDAAIEFPPNNYPLNNITDKYVILNPEFNGKICDYSHFLELGIHYKRPTYKKFRGVCPNWDNEARRPGHGLSFVNATPENYRKWLEVVSNFTASNFKKEEQFIFINAWNEWAEGAHLEPDNKYGYGYLHETAEVLKKYPSR